MDGLTNPKPGAKPASAFQQKQFDLLLGRARQLMGEAGEEWVSGLKADPVASAVMMGVETVREVATMSEKAGQKVDPVVLINVGVQFIKDIAAVANAAGSVPDEGLEQFLQEVMSQSIAQYLRLDAEDGIISPQDKQQAEGMLAQMQGGSPSEPAAPAAPAQPAVPAEPMAETEEEDDPEMAAELKAIRKAKGGA
jgi:hypothetical protein